MGGTILDMGDSPTPLPSFGATANKKDEGYGPPLIPLAIGVAAVLIVIGAFFVFGGKGANENSVPAAADPYAANLAISDVAMSTADNFAGQEVTYIEGKVANKGGKTVNGALVQIIFHDSLNQVAQKETQRVMAITTREPYIDTAPLSSAPLRPGQTREFRLTFEHISADWNMQLPEITIAKTSTE